METDVIEQNFLDYLAHAGPPDENPQLPSLIEISKELGISISLLREQVEVAKALGFISVRPRTGIQRQPFTFFPAVQKSLSYALELSESSFKDFADLRNQIEACYWENAAKKLLPGDKVELQTLLSRAWTKLRGTPIIIPHEEHRLIHLTIYRRLDNIFVLGILEAFWDAYEAVGLSMYADYEYLNQVWTYHQMMVDAISNENYADGYEALVNHKDLLYHRTSTTK